MVDKKKPTYREKNGTTRVGDFLRNLGKPETLKKILGAAGNVVTGDWGGVIDIITESDELSEQEKSLAIKEIEKDIVEQKEVSKRWKADMHSDSWLSKNIRPMTLIFLLLSTITVLVLDASIKEFKVEEYWVTLLGSMAITALGGYFALREVGKFVNRKYKE